MCIYCEFTVIIYSGGVPLTVIGQNLASSACPVMRITVVQSSADRTKRQTDVILGTCSSTPVNTSVLWPTL